MENEELLKKDLATIIRLATDILLKNELDINDFDFETTSKIKQLLTLLDNNTNMEIPF